MLSPEDKKGIVFATYGGYHFGPKEAVPALSLMELEMEHLRYVCMGSFACPGKFLPFDVPGGWYQDLTTRPNKRDLLKAEIFLEEVLEGL